MYNKNKKFSTFLNPLENEEPNEERRKYIGDLVCIKNIIEKFFDQNYLLEDGVNGSELAIFKIILYTY